MRAFQVGCAVVLLGFSPLLAQSPDELIQRLKDPEARSRRLAAEALGKGKVTAAIPALAELLKDKESSVRQAAADALVRLSPKGIAALAGALAYPEAESRLVAVTALRRCGPAGKEALTALMAALKDQNTDVRIRAASVLGGLGTDAKSALPALFEAARDTSNVGAVVRFDWPSSVTDAATEAALAIDPDCKAALAKAALPDLIKAVESKDEAVLQAVGHALVRLGPHAKPALAALQQAQKNATQRSFAGGALDRAIQAIVGKSAALAEVIKDPKAPLDKRLRALSELSWSKDVDDRTVPLLLEALGDSEPKIRAAAVQGLGRLGPKAKTAVPVLLKLLEDDALEKAASETDRGSSDVVVETLARIGTDAVPGLAGILQEDTNKPIVRWKAARAFTRLGRKARTALPVLKAASKDRRLGIAIESACAYARAGGEVAEVMPLLRASLKREQAVVLWTGAAAIERIGPTAQAAVPELIPLLKHEDREVRIIAARALSQMGSAARPGVPAMAELLKEDDDRQRYQVAGALQRLGPNAREALPALIERLKDLEQMSPNPILVTLGNLGPEAKAAVPALVEVLKKGDRLISDDALEALARIGPDAQAAVPAITGLLEKMNLFTRARAARALGQIGPKAKTAVPTLHKLLEDESTMVRVWAAFALARITGDVKPHLERILELRQEDSSGKGKDGVRCAVSYDVAQALELLGGEASPALDILLEALLDKKTPAGTHRHVARALGHLQKDADAIVTKLIALLERPAEGFQRQDNCEHAAEALGMLGPKAKAALPVLRRLAQDQENEIAEAAAKALEKIEPR